MKNSSGYAVLNPYVVTILQTQKHLPTEVLKDIVRLFTSTARTELDQILKDYRPSRSQMLLLRSEFLANLQLKSTEGDHNMTEAFYIPRFEPPILSERLLKGQEWTDQIYERIASLWEYGTKGWLMEYICSAPDLPVSWQKNLINDIISGETGRMGRALRIISSQRHATPALEQLFQSEIEKAEPSHLNKLFMVLYPLFGNENAGIKNVWFSREMWFWLFSKLKISSPGKGTHDSYNEIWTNDKIMAMGFGLVKGNSNAPDWVYDRLVKWLNEEPLTGAKELRRVIWTKGELLSKILERMPEDSVLFQAMDSSDRLELTYLRKDLDKTPISRCTIELSR
ncbi:MAG: hypothetical protein IPK68_11540 [Bdellovibrionales bacterium]|nr:hypothetical protein [Bdellovibrionales bacterium]